LLILSNGREEGQVITHSKSTLLYIFGLDAIKDLKPAPVKYLLRPYPDTILPLKPTTVDISKTGLACRELSINKLDSTAESCLINWSDIFRTYHLGSFGGIDLRLIIVTGHCLDVSFYYFSLLLDFYQL